VAGRNFRVVLTKYNYNLRKPLILLVLVLVSCAGSPSVEAIAPEQIARAEALPESRFFGGKLVQCEDKDRTARELFSFIMASIRLPLDTRVMFKEYRVSPYADGQVYEIVIEFERDSRETSTWVDLLVVRNDCALGIIDDFDVGPPR